MAGSIETASKYRERADYREIQLTRHDLKKSVQRDIKEYMSVVNNSRAKGCQFTGRMLCLGTRNNHEKKCFADCVPAIAVSSLDIAPAACADYTQDFNDLPLDWTETWDVVYSNCLDHSPTPTSTFDMWLRIIKPSGFLLLALDYGADMSDSDPSIFDRENVLEFLSHVENITVHGSCQNDYETWIIQKHM